MDSEFQRYWTGTVTTIDDGMPDDADVPALLKQPSIRVAFDGEALGTIGLPKSAARGPIAPGDRVFVRRGRVGHARRWMLERIPPAWEDPAV